ncbi:MAG: hypothetical protein V2A34_10540, partial [Lentisphaerota bacterium]
ASRTESPASFQLESKGLAGVSRSFLIPDHTLQETTMIRLVYKNMDEGNVTVLFDPRDGVEMLPYHGAFLPNYIRALLMLFAHLALLAAIGVTAGCIFSMPVASFLSLFALILLALNGMITQFASASSLLAPDGHAGAAPTLWLILVRALYKSLNFLLQPLQVANPFETLSMGVNLEWSVVAYVFLVKGLLYSGLLAAIGLLVFRRREIAMPL